MAKRFPRFFLLWCPVRSLVLFFVVVCGYLGFLSLWPDRLFVCFFVRGRAVLFAICSLWPGGVLGYLSLWPGGSNGCLCLWPSGPTGCLSLWPGGVPGFLFLWPGGSTGCLSRWPDGSLFCICGKAVLSVSVAK